MKVIYCRMRPMERHLREHSCGNVISRGSFQGIRKKKYPVYWPKLELGTYELQIAGVTPRSSLHMDLLLKVYVHMTLQVYMHTQRQGY
jgi:hypothetical protein